MRNALRHYFQPTDDELKELWKHGLFSFDASVLLNIYGYSRDTREELVDLLEKKAARIKLPYQFALEYARDRSVVIIKQVNNYLRVEKELKKIKAEFASKRDHPFLSKDSLDSYEEIIGDLEMGRQEMERLVGADHYAERLLRLLDGRVGPKPTDGRFDELCAEAKARYDTKTPPGYADAKEKPIPDAYGDYFGWAQLIEIAKSEDKGVILVTDDFKSDWWRYEKERTVGPLPELLEEFVRLSGKPFFMYTSENFLRAAKKLAFAEVHDDVIEEVRGRLESQRADQFPSDDKVQSTRVSASMSVLIADADSEIAGEKARADDRQEQEPKVSAPGEDRDADTGSAPKIGSEE